MFAKVLFFLAAVSVIAALPHKRDTPDVKGAVNTIKDGGKTAALDGALAVAGPAAGLAVSGNQALSDTGNNLPGSLGTAGGAAGDGANTVIKGASGLAGSSQ